MRSAKTRHRRREVGGLTVHYRESGTPAAAAVLFLHGYPSSSYSFRDVLPVVGQHAYAVAPDLPGFGFSDAPPVAEYDYTFDHLSQVVEDLVVSLGVKRYVLYVTDWGTPVGYALALRHPERVLGLVVQNGNAHEEGLHEAWDAPRRYWADPSEENRAALGEWMHFDGTRDEYLAGLPDDLRELQPPESWHLDWERMSREGNVEAKFALFTDYANHVARFPAITEYHQEHQPPCLVLWGRHDPFFDIAEVMAYHREMTRLDVHLYDAGHALLETHAAEVADLLVTFIGDTFDR